MGIGGALQGIFGGGNSYNATMSPTLGSPKRNGESNEAYKARLYNEYAATQNDYERAIKQAMGQKIDKNVLDFNQSNNTAAQQKVLNQQLGQRANQNINFGSQPSMDQQQGLINQLIAQGQGQGPNPAMDQLRMTTDQNARQQAALVAGARGVNPALAARLAAQQGASINQQAAGQAALQSAQQQLAAQQQAGGLLGQQIGQQTQQAGLNAQQQQAYNQLLAQNLSSQRGQDIGQATAQGQAGLGLMANRTAAEAMRRQAQAQEKQRIDNAYNAMNNINAGVAAQNSSQEFQYGAGAMSGLSSALQSAALMNKGGVVNMAKGGMSQSDGGLGSFQNFQSGNPFYSQLAEAGNVASKTGKDIQESFTGLTDPNVMKKVSSLFENKLPMMAGDAGIGEAAGAEGGLDVLSQVAPLALASNGGKVSGKAKVKGDSVVNDTVPAMLSPGEIVIPRTATETPEDAHAFLDKIIKKNNGSSYKEILDAKQHYHNMAHGGEMASCMYCGGMA